jgi:hypothetical protein
MRTVQTVFCANTSGPGPAGHTIAATRNKKSNIGRSLPAFEPQIRFGIHDRWRHQKFSWPLVGFLLTALGAEGVAVWGLQQVFKESISNSSQRISQTNQKLDQIEKALTERCPELKKEPAKSVITLKEACNFPPSIRLPQSNQKEP